jgi:methylglutaconyl-CoA hydratase
MSDLLQIHADQRGVCTLTLNRPECHNAFNAELIERLLTDLSLINEDPTVRMLVLTGAGKSFSSGADLEWMQQAAQQDEAGNRQDAEELAALMRTLYELDKPSIARINGPAYGGGLGLIACCDVAIASSSARFAFTEVRLGLIPAVISPYILNAIGLRQARRLFLTAEQISAVEAQTMGLVHQVVEPEQLDEAVEVQVDLLLKGGPIAQAESKRLLRCFDSDDMDAELAALIAELRASSEGQAGLDAFLKKTKPPWVKK